MFQTVMYHLRTKMILRSFVIGLGLFLLGALVFAPLSVVIPSWVSFLDETTMLIVGGYLLYQLKTTKWFLVLSSLLALYIGYTFVPGAWFFGTSNYRMYHVDSAGTDENNAGTNTAFTVDMTDKLTGEDQSYHVRDLVLFPWIWQKDSGDDRRKLRAAVGKDICAWTTGIRLHTPTSWPYVLEVYDDNTNCQ